MPEWFKGLVCKTSSCKAVEGPNPSPIFMKPYGRTIKTPRHINGGNMKGYYCNFYSACGCCDGPYTKKHKSMKACERRKNKFLTSVRKLAEEQGIDFDDLLEKASRHFTNDTLPYKRV